METINVSLPGVIQEFVDRQVAIRGLSAPGAYVQALIQEAYKASLEAQVLAGLEALERGEASDMTSKDWERLRREYKERHGQSAPK